MSLRTATKYYATTFYHYNLVQSNVSCLRSTIQHYDTMAHYRPYRECYGLLWPKIKVCWCKLALTLIWTRTSAVKLTGRMLVQLPIMTDFDPLALNTLIKCSIRNLLVSSMQRTNSSNDIFNILESWGVVGVEKEWGGGEGGNRTRSFPLVWSLGSTRGKGTCKPCSDVVCATRQATKAEPLKWPEPDTVSASAGTSKAAEQSRVQCLLARWPEKHELQMTRTSPWQGSSAASSWSLVIQASPLHSDYVVTRNRKWPPTSPCPIRRTTSFSPGFTLLAISWSETKHLKTKTEASILGPTWVPIKGIGRLSQSHPASPKVTRPWGNRSWIGQIVHHTDRSAV